MCFLSCPSAVYTTYWLLLSQTLLLWGVSWTEDIPLNPQNIPSAVLHSAMLWVGLRLHIVRLLVLHATGSYWSLLAVSDTFLLQQKVKSTFYRVTPHSRRYKIHAFVIQLWNNINYPASTDSGWSQCPSETQNYTRWVPSGPRERVMWVKRWMQYVKICMYEIRICGNRWDLYRRWNCWAEAAAAWMLVMVVSCQSRQRSTSTRRVTPDEVEGTPEDVWRWTEVTSYLDNGLWKLELGGVWSSRRSWGLDLRTERPWPSLD